ncbi:hypothetical protein [Streptomyces sp. SD15]
MSRSYPRRYAKGVALPWKKTVEVPLGRPPVVTVTLGERGGQAGCTLAIRGRHGQMATASGRFGHATCQGSCPRSDVGDAALWRHSPCGLW